ncbi:MAG: SycD/LcrH family type III secretion system chaperone [Verrucomicrobia bacterium]|nr:SycD/LcrH family type III secretion system chaperone [Verrucomicrobiota bacterium]
MSTNPNEYDAMDLPKIQESLQKINFAAGEKARVELKEILESSLKKGIMPKTALQINDDTMEAIYTQGYNLYNMGKYKEASYVFRLLMMLDFSTPKYILGLAACSHRLKDYSNASNLYLLCAALDPTNPLPHFHAADCYLQLSSPSIACISLGMAITAAGDQPQYALIRERASLMKAALDQQLGTGTVSKQLETTDAPLEETETSHKSSQSDG